MVDCPRCDAKLKKMPQGKQNKKLREKWKRKYKGGVDIKKYGDDRPITVEGQNRPIPNGAKVIEKCGSCGWTSIRTYNAGNREWTFEVY